MLTVNQLAALIAGLALTGVVLWLAGVWRDEDGEK
jgi:hypothetical protein